ncbi:MAG TPA: hypothetical protein VGG03_27535 [Thermoanaerobaculia bacterium]|jgi:hypothetical protein
MRKLTFLTGAMLVLAFALAGGFSMPRAAWAFCYCDPNEPYSYTNLNWGQGVDCVAAQNNLRSYTSSEAYAACGGATQTCLGALINTSQCYWNGWSYQTGGYQEYKCKVCEPRPPREPY